MTQIQIFDVSSVLENCYYKLLNKMAYVLFFIELLVIGLFN